MTFWLWILAAVLVFAVFGGLGAMLAVTVPIAKRVYFQQLVRTSPDKWGHECSAPDNGEQLQMWTDGLAWGEENKAFAKPVSVKNGELSLYGEYYDFGSNKCVIIVPGRCECLKYSYYFAQSYKDAGMNVLVIDSRCHGMSDGTYSTIGDRESGDLIKWMSYMESEFAVKSFWLHGICIGSSAALLAAASADCTKNLGGIVLEGCFVNFRESFKEHMVADKRPLFPVLDLVMLFIRIYAKTNIHRTAPIKTVKRINCPILFLFGKQDIYSVPAKSKKLFGACASQNKKLVWFDKGSHSHLRINNTEKYDNAIMEFVSAYED